MKAERKSRRSKFTPELKEGICEMIARGLTYAQAAEASGIHRDTLHEWERTKPDFSDAIKKAKTLGIERRLARIEKAAEKGAWQADAWWLERNQPEQWGRRQKSQVEIVESEQPPRPDDEAIERARRALQEQWTCDFLELFWSEVESVARANADVLSFSQIRDALSNVRTRIHQHDE